MNRKIITIGMLALAAAGTASASSLTYNNRGNWALQVTSLTNFDGGAQAVGTSSTIANGGLFSTNLQIDGFDLDLTHPLSLIRANAGAGQNYYNWGSGSIIRTQDKTAMNAPFARITFAAPVSAFGFNYGIGGCPTFFAGCFPGAAGSITLAPNGLAPISLTTVQSPTLAFWGVVSDTQTFTYADIYINDTNRYLVLDDIAHGSAVAPASETAEPGTLIQLAMGGILLAIARRKFRTAQLQTI